MTGGYSADLAAVHGAGFTAPARAAAQALAGRLPPRARVIDLGCGDGTSAEVLDHAGHTVHGIDLSPAFVVLARERVPAATFAVGSFLDAELDAGCDAVLAVGEVLGYLFDERLDDTALDVVFARCAEALRPGGLLLFDLAGPGRIPTGGQRHWTEGDGWAVLLDARVAGRQLTRRLITFRDRGDGRYARTEETHPQRLHPPAEVLARLERAGFDAEILAGGYGDAVLPPGVTAYLARRRGLR